MQDLDHQQYVGGSLYSHGPQNPILIIKAPILPLFGSMSVEGKMGALIIRRGFV